MIGLALSGGGSRAIAFHLGCLRALKDLEILDRVNVLSTISGGSVIGAYYAYTPTKSFEEFESDIRGFLRGGFQQKIFDELIKPQNLFPCVANFIFTHYQEAASLIYKKLSFTDEDLSWPLAQRYPSRTDMFHNVLQRDVFPSISMSSTRRHDIEVIIGSCELRTGSAFRFGNHRSGGWRHGEMTAWDVDVAFAVAASAAYPIFLPAFDRTWSFQKNGLEKDHRVLLTDGGVYDNLGVQVLEPGRNPKVSLHTFPCDYLIVCNAGHGQESGDCIPLGSLSRVAKSFEVVHRRVQDSTMNRLHHLKEARIIKGFAMPYLGQQDNLLPWKPGVLVPRDEVIKYPTNFAAMDEEWINKLSNRGEQLARLLVSCYLRDLL